MIGESRHPTNMTEDVELHRFVRDALTVHRFGAEVMRIDRRLYDYRSSFTLEEVIAYFADGSQLPLIFKSLSPDCLLSHARAVRPADAYDPAREIFAYRELLPRLSTGVPLCYATVADAQQQRYWLLLEKAPGVDLARSGDFEVWRETARWLATAQRRLTAAYVDCSGSERIVHYDDACFTSWVEQAERALQSARKADGRAVRSWEITWLLERARTAARIASRLPTAVIHGDFYPSNVLIDAAAPPRICILDWETIGIGPALLDLAALVSGSWSENQRAQLASAYFEHAASAVSTSGEIPQHLALQCCRLMLAMKWIGWSVDWEPPPEHAHDWLGEALELAREVNGGLELATPPLESAARPWIAF